MHVTILGSGTNLHPTRAAAGYLVRTDHHLLFDLGPRTLTNLLKTGVNRHGISHVLFSHFHADHFSDFITFFFDALIVTKFQGGTRGPLTIIGPHGTADLFRVLFATLPGFTDPPFKVRFKEVADRPFRIGATKIWPRTVTHSPGLHAVGYRVEYNGTALAYSGDSEYCPNLVQLCRDADMAILDCSYPANRPGPAHLHAGQCGQVAQEAGVGQLILSHFYPLAERYDVEAQAAASYGGRIRKGKDMLTIRL
jgi:ribonuclease BN (tRNA processing enzyme)